jgi:universal stress protein E
MGPVRRILVAVGDPLAERLPAIAKATQLARAFGADLELFHALDSPYYVDMLAGSAGQWEPLEGDERRDVLQRLGRVAARTRLHGVNVSVAVERDYPAYEAIVRQAVHTGADFIVAECHAGRHVAAGLLGLVDWELLHLSPVPVLLVKKHRPYRRPVVLAAVDPGHAFAKPANLDVRILRVAAALSRALRGVLHVVHGCTEPNANLSVISAAAALRTYRAELARARSSFERLLRPTAIPAARQHLIGGLPGAAVREMAGRLNADIAVLGCVSRSGLNRLLVGNTAGRLLGRLPCDLLVVKPAEFADRVPAEARGARVLPVQPLY